jgi:hypothetical protein
MGVRKSLAALALAAAFGAGVLTSHALEREAKAQRSATTSAVFVPSDGLAFRTLEGRMIARLAYDARGGFLEVYDEHERPAASLRSVSVSAARPAQGPAPGPATAGNAANAANAAMDLDLGY